MTDGEEADSRYELSELLGKGGMGEVYLAQDVSLNRKVALKFLPDSLQQDVRARKRFEREARAAASLDHPFICRVYETGELNGKAFMSMEYVAGETLRDRLDRGAFSLKEALDIACEIGEALEFAHEYGIVHRDLKPANIMLTPQGHVKIMDFGLAKVVLSQEQMGNMETASVSDFVTQQGTLVGTPAYMSPEQAMGGPVDKRSDVFTFGVVLYEMLSGKQPFYHKSAVETLTSILRDESPPLRLEESGTPAFLMSVLKKAMAKKVEDRYQSANELIKDLKQVREKQFRPKRPAWVVWAMIGATILLVTLIAMTLWFMNRAPSPVPSTSETAYIS